MLSIAPLTSGAYTSYIIRYKDIVPISVYRNCNAYDPPAVQSNHHQIIQKYKMLEQLIAFQVRLASIAVCLKLT